MKPGKGIEEQMTMDGLPIQSSSFASIAFLSYPHRMQFLFIMQKNK
jgi:hypothetical protein